MVNWEMKNNITTSEVIQDLRYYMSNSYWENNVFPAWAFPLNGTDLNSQAHILEGYNSNGTFKLKTLKDGCFNYDYMTFYKGINYILIEYWRNRFTLNSKVAADIALLCVNSWELMLTEYPKDAMTSLFEACKKLP